MLSASVVLINTTRSIQQPICLFNSISCENINHSLIIICLQHPSEVAACIAGCHSVFLLRLVAAGYVTSAHMECSAVHWRVWWSRQQSPLLPPVSASCCTWGTGCCAPVRLSSRWWGSSAGQRRWVGPRAYVDPGGGGPRSPCAQPLNTPSHLREPAVDEFTESFSGNLQAHVSFTDFQPTNHNHLSYMVLVWYDDCT